jgi:hypothetical protein
MTAQKTETAGNPFREFEPVEWKPGESSSLTVFSVRRNHGVKGTYILHNLNDQINDNRPALEKVLLEYRIKHISCAIFTVADLFGAEYGFDRSSEGNILGDLAERISRRIAKYFLKHHSRHGKTGAIFDQRYNRLNREEYIVAHSQEYILKIQKYPRLIILKQSGKGRFGYENIKELDGFFSYRFHRQRHILVLESKLETINVDCDDLIRNLFHPLHSLFPDSFFHYLMFTDRESLYQKKHFEKRRQLKQAPLKIFHRLKADGIGSLFFHFNEHRQDFERMKDHLITQYRAINKMGVTIYGKSVISEKELAIFDGGETPHIKLVKDPSSGLWREVRLHHKSMRPREPGGRRSG